MTWREALAEYTSFRERLKPIVTKRLPDDPALIWNERADLEPMFFEAMEHEATLESFYLKEVCSTYEDPECKSYDYAVAKCHEFKMWSKKASAAVKAIESRSIKLSQSYKLTEGKH